MKALIFFLFSTILFINTYGQIKILNYTSNSSYEKYRSEITKAIKKNNKDYTGYVNLSGTPNLKIDSNIQYSIYPLRKISIPLFTKKISENISCEEPNSLIIIPDLPREAVYEYYIKDGSISLLGDVRRARYLSNIDSAKSSELSFFYLTERDKYLNNDILLYNHSSIIMINGNNNHQFLSIKDYVCDRFGNEDNLLTMLNDDQENKMVHYQAFQDFIPKRDAESFIKENWLFRCNSLPNDTTSNIECIMSDIHKYAKISAQQSLIIAQLIKKELQEPLPNYKSIPPIEVIKNSIVFMRHDIYPTLSANIDPTKLKEYQHHLKIMNLQFHAVDEYVYLTYLGSYPTLAAKSEAYTRYIISLINR